ncbi:TPA: hypothetical protein ACH3X1_011744 [Trebouxia sp. C0004]
MPMPTYVNERPVKTGCWTEREDELLAEWQGRYGNRWCMVAKKISGRTGQQCAQRWRHKVNPNIKKEKWSPAEDERLLVLYEEHGGSWAQISRHLEGRTDQQCMGRWKRHLDPTITREAWTDEEDSMLHDQFLIHGSQWSSIARSLPGRTAQQCRARWFQVGGGGCKLGAKGTARLRQHREDGSWSDDGTAYQDDLNSDVDLSDDDEGADWEGGEHAEDESWGQQISTPKTSRARALGRASSSGHRMSQVSALSRTLSRRSARHTPNPKYDSPDSAAGSNAGPFGDGSFHGSGNLDDVEEADIEAGQILTALKSSPSPIRRVRDQRWAAESSGRLQKGSPTSQKGIPMSQLAHNSSAARTLGADEGAGLLQANSLAGSAPNESVLYSPIARRPYTRNPNGRTAAADLPAGLATPQTPRSVSRLAGISPGPGPWPAARSPSVPIMTMLQSPQAPDSDTFLRSPSSFQGLVTPDWSTKLTHPKPDPQTCPPSSQGWTPSRLGGGSRTGVRHTVARRLNVDQALKGAGPLGSGLAPLTVPQNLPSELEGQGSGAGEEGQDVGSPMKKMRMGSGLAQAREADDAVRACLHHYIAARQQNSFGNSSDAANTTFSGISSTAHQLHIQPLCLTGSPTASSSPGMASSGNLSIPATHSPPLGTLTGAAAHAYFFTPGLRTLSGSGSGSRSGHFDAGHLDTRPLGAAPAGAQLDLSQLAATQPIISQEVAQLLAGAFAARATATAGDRSESNCRLTDKENSACIAFDEMSMGRQEASSLADAASNLSEIASGSQQSGVSESGPTTAHVDGPHDMKLATPSGGSTGARVTIDTKRSVSGKLDTDGCQGRSAARRLKLHAMLENL